MGKMPTPLSRASSPSVLFPVQVFLTQNQHTIRYVFWMCWAALLIFLVTTAQETSFLIWLEWGKRAANISLIVFCITLLPGIMKRFGWTRGILLPIRSLIMLFRKEIGITMFLFALAHYIWSRMLPLLAFGGDLLSFQPFELFGMIAFTLAIPMFLTSNSYTYKNHKRLWKTLHSATYIIVWMVFLHIAVRQPSLKGGVVLVFALLEWSSLLSARLRKTPLGVSANLSSSTRSTERPQN